MIACPNWSARVDRDCNKVKKSNFQYSKQIEHWVELTMDRYGYWAMRRPNYDIFFLPANIEFPHTALLRVSTRTIRNF